MSSDRIWLASSSCLFCASWRARQNCFVEALPSVTPCTASCSVEDTSPVGLSGSWSEEGESNVFVGENFWENALMELDRSRNLFFASAINCSSVGTLYPNANPIKYRTSSNPLCRMQ